MSYAQGGFVSCHVNNTINWLLVGRRNYASSETLLCMWSHLVPSQCKLKNRGQTSGIINVAERLNRMLRLSGNTPWLTLIHFPTGDSAEGSFPGNFQVLYFHFLLFSLASHLRSSLGIASEHTSLSHLQSRHWLPCLPLKDH